MLLINTRPADRAGELTQAVSAQGYRVENLPLLVLKKKPFSAHLKQLYQQLDQSQLIVVVSPTAVEIGMQYLQKANISLSSLSHIRWVAVGKSTAKALQYYGISAEIPQVETSEGMLQLPVFQMLKSFRQVAFWRGEGGRQLMMQQLIDQGVRLLNFILYDRQCPESATQKILSIAHDIAQDKQPVWVLITSEASWLNWLSLIQPHAALFRDCHYLVLGERLEQILTIYQNQHQLSFNMIRLENLKASSIVQHLDAL
ncbi:uroporphyrinogen-III synthase [Acinetobacter baylyi]|uniref:uroporphyrinogen-III synthase n=1 Tax=Acinetobacter baylyi TaxID=202950 RepID=UPI0031DF6A9E